MSKRHLELLRQQVTQQGAHTIDVNQIQRESLTVNDRIARWTSRHVGTMWFCYVLALLMMGWAIVQWKLGQTAFDAFPFPFLFFCLGGIMQSLLMPMIMVTQNLDARHAESRSELDLHVNQESFARLEQVIQRLDTHHEMLLLLKLQSEARLKKRRIPTELPVN